MPRPQNERQALEEELAELPAQSVAYQRDLAAMPAHDKTRREMREWQISTHWFRRAALSSLRRRPCP